MTDVVPHPGETWEWKSEKSSDPQYHYQVKVRTLPEEDNDGEFRASVVRVFSGSSSIHDDGTYIYPCSGGTWKRVFIGYCASCDQIHEAEDYLCSDCRSKA